MTNEQRILNALIGARQMLSSLDKISDNDDLWDKAIEDIKSHMGEPMNDSEFRLMAVIMMDTVHESIIRFAHEEATAIRETVMKQQMHERRN